MSYYRVHKPEHPRADIAGFVGEHILVAEEMYGESFQKGSDVVIHHKDFHKPNNARMNLQKMTRKEHQQIPAMQARFLSEQGLMDKFFEWWHLEKHDVQTAEQKIEVQLVAAHNDRERIRVKLRKQEKNRETR